MKKIMSLLVSLATSSSYAGYQQIGEFPDRFEILENIQNLTATDIKDIASRREKILLEMEACFPPSAPDTQHYDVLFSELYGFKQDIASFVQSFELLDELEEILRETGKEQTGVPNELLPLYNKLIDLDSEKCKFLKKIISQQLINESMWEKAEKIIYLIKSLEKGNNNYLSFGRFAEKEFYEDLRKGARTLDTLLKDGDILVGPGNTPQFLMEAYKFFNENAPQPKQIQFISMALSGWPGVFKHGFLQNVLTQQAIENYRIYMDKVGFSPSHIKGGRVFLLDIISGGGGLEFLVEEFTKGFGSPAEIPDINIISINELSTGNKFKGKIFEIDNINLNLPRLGGILDKVDQKDNFKRYLPDFPAWRWHTWIEPHPFSGGAASMVIDNIRHPEREPWGIYNLNICESMPKGLFAYTYYSGTVNTDLWHWKRAVGAYKQASEDPRFKKWFDTHIDLEYIGSEFKLEEGILTPIRELIGYIKDESTRLSELALLEGLVTHFMQQGTEAYLGEYAADLIGTVAGLIEEVGEI